MTAATLYNYFRSSTSYRVRIALRLKGIDYDYVPIHIRKGEQEATDYRALNPQRLVPTLVLEDQEPLTQSLAILEYLDERFPQPPLLPSTPEGRMQVRRMAQIIALDIHPLNNLRVLGYLRKTFAADDEAVVVWFRTWVGEGFAALEVMLERFAGRFCFGNAPTIADLCLVAQVANNRRFSVDMTPYPTIAGVYERCMEIPAFAESAPERQPDAE